MSGIVFDLIILALLVFFFIRGRKKGLLLSLCGLAVVIVSFFGAVFVADVLDEPVADALQPVVERFVKEQMSSRMEDLGGGSGGGLQLPDSFDGLDLPDLDDLPQWARDALENTDLDLRGVLNGGNVQGAVDDLVAETVHTAAIQLAHGILFGLSFILLNILLTVLLHTLDLVAKLPGLNFFNELGGGLLSLVKGILIVFVAVAVVQISSLELFTADTVKNSYLLKFFVEYNPILSLVRP